MTARLDEQEAAIERLSSRCDERIDTHAALVFLVGDRVYKIKRAVRYSYLDFSSVEKRAKAAQAEVDLNRRTAPDLYLGVETICGEPVVVMRTFDQSLLFDRMAERGLLDDAMIEELSAEIAAFHRSAEITRGMGGRASLEIEVAGNDHNLAAAPPGTLSQGLCEVLVRRWRGALQRHAELLDRRDQDGKVRRCHGDLHLRNICLWQGRPTLFDCIEFSEHLSCIDVLYDLAFLLMDLRHRKLDRFANIVFNRYLDCYDQTDGLPALSLMMSLRAAIRAHTGVAAAAAQAQAERSAGMLEEAKSYLSLAERLMDERPPVLVAIGGISGTGKSTLARELAPSLGSAPGARVFHTDAVRKELFGVERTERLPEAAYAPAVSENVYRLQRERAASALRARRSTIVDGVFGDPSERAAIAGLARAHGAPFLGLWLTAPAEIARPRIAARSGDMSDATVEVLARQLESVGEVRGWAHVDASREPAAVGAAARALLTSLQ